MKKFSYKVSPFWLLWLSPPVLIFGFISFILAGRFLEVLEPYKTLLALTAFTGGVALSLAVKYWNKSLHLIQAMFFVFASVTSMLFAAGLWLDSKSIFTIAMIALTLTLEFLVVLSILDFRSTY